MGGIRERISNFLLKGMTQFFSQSTMIGSKYIMPEDNLSTYIKKGLLYNPDVAAVIGYIRDVAVGVPWTLKKGDNVIEEHQLLNVWKNPNPITNGKLLRGKYIEHYLATGNAYLHGLAPENGINTGKIIELYNLKYDMHIEKGTAEPIKYYEDPASKANYAAESVLHWKTTDPDGDGYYGTSPLKAGRLVLQQSNDAYLANSKSLQNMGVQGILTRKDLDNAGPEQAKKLKEKFKREQTGAENFNKLTLAAGEYEYIKLGLSPVDMALLDAQIKSRQAICNIYKFPSELLNDKASSTYNNMMEKRKQLMVNIVMPMLEDLKEMLAPWFVQPWDEGFEFGPDWGKVPEMQDDLDKLATWLDKAWWVKGIDKQRIMNVEEDTDMDKYYVPANLIPEENYNEDALKEYKE